MLRFENLVTRRKNLPFFCVLSVVGTSFDFCNYMIPYRKLQEANVWLPVSLLLFYGRDELSQEFLFHTDSNHRYYLAIISKTEVVSSHWDLCDKTTSFVQVIWQWMPWRQVHRHKHTCNYTGLHGLETTTNFPVNSDKRGSGVEFQGKGRHDTNIYMSLQSAPQLPWQITMGN